MKKFYFLILIFPLILSSCKKDQVSDNESLPVNFEPIFDTNWQLDHYGPMPSQMKSDSLGKIIIKVTKATNQFGSYKTCFSEENGCEMEPYSSFPSNGIWIIKKGALVINSTTDNKKFVYKIDDITKDSLKLTEIPYDYFRENCSYVFKPVYP